MAPRRHPSALALVVALLLLVGTSACRPPADGATSGASSVNGADGAVEVSLLTRPARVGPAALEVRVVRDGVSVEGATVRFTGDMTHAGMVPVLADGIELGDGIYRSDGFAFDMAGDWVITVDVRHADGSRDQGTLAVQVAR